MTTTAMNVQAPAMNMAPQVAPLNGDVPSVMLRLGKVFAHTTLIERVYYKSTNIRICIDLFRNDGIRRKEGARHSTSDLYLVAPDVATAFVKPSSKPAKASAAFYELALVLERFYTKLKTQPPVRTKSLRASWNEIEPIADKLFTDMAILLAQKYEFKKSSVTIFVNSYNSTLNKHLRAYDQKMFSEDMQTCSIRALKTLNEAERAVIYAIRNGLDIPQTLTNAYQTLQDKLFVCPSSQGILLLIPDPKQEVGKKSYAQYCDVVVDKVVSALPATSTSGDVATFLDTPDEEAETPNTSATGDSLLELWGEYLTALAQKGNITPSNTCVRIHSPVMNHAREYSLRRLMGYLDLVVASAPTRNKSKTVYAYTALPSFFRVEFTSAGLKDYVRTKDLSASVYEKFVESVKSIVGDSSSPVRITNNDIVKAMGFEDPLGGYDLDNFRKIAILRGDLEVTREGIYYNYAKVKTSPPVVVNVAAPEPTPEPAPEVTWPDVMSVKVTREEMETQPVPNVIQGKISKVPGKVVSSSGKFESQPAVVTEADLPYMKRGPKFVEPPKPALQSVQPAQDGPLISPYGVRTEAVLSMVRLKMSLSGKPVPLTELCKVFESDLTSDQMWRVLKTLDEKQKVILSYPETIPVVHAHAMSDKGIEIKFVIPRDQVWVEYVES